jgi:hypothetical protein
MPQEFPFHIGRCFHFVVEQLVEHGFWKDFPTTNQSDVAHVVQHEAIQQAQDAGMN